MPSLNEYIDRVLTEAQEPQVGDELDFELREQLVVECRIVDRTQDGIVVAADSKTVSLLESYGVVLEAIQRYGAVEESVMSEIDMDLRHIAKTESFDALQDAIGGQFGASTKRYLEDLMMDIARDHRLHYDDDIDEIMELVMDRIVDMYGDELDEAEYQGRDVDLNKPTRGDVKKFKVYVKDPKTGNVKKVNFGDPNMRIKKSNPDRRRSFRARHRCDTAKDKTTARYWSCRKW